MSKTPWFASRDYRPIMVGPYECKMPARYERSTTTPVTHLRWWDGQRWSFPLGVDPAEPYTVTAPHADNYPPDQDNLVSEIEFDWRGYNEDQDPL